MPEINVDVDNSAGLARIIGVDVSDLDWSHIRDAIEFTSADARVIGDRRLDLPVWALLRAKDDLYFAIQQLTRASVKVSISDSAKRLLKESTVRQRILREPVQEISDIELRDRLRNLQFGRMLKTYQARNVRYLMTIPAGATFSVPGAGKTTEALALYALKRSETTKLLVISPKNAFSVWEEQIALCLPSMKGKVCRLRGNSAQIDDMLDSDSEAYLINYDLVPRYSGILLRLCLKSNVFLVLDESHRIKAWPAKVTGSAILNIAPFAADRLVMSGTPMPNSTTDLVPQYSFLYPESRKSGGDVLNAFAEIFVRTKKSELKLPRLVRSKVLVPMREGQAQLYRAMTNDFAGNFSRLSVGDRLMFRRMGKAVMRLIQAASEPALLSNTGVSNHDLVREASSFPSPKIEHACQIARALAKKNSKCIIWTNFIGNVLQLSEQLRDLGAEFIYGEVQTSEDDQVLDSREAKIRRFKESSDCFVLVANPGACAESISLHEVCHHAIYVDRTYNAGQYLQSEDRIHRLGLSPGQITYIHLLVSPGTIDESIERRLSAKVQRMSQFLNDPGLTIASHDLMDDDSVGLDSDDLTDLRLLIGLPQ